MGCPRALDGRTGRCFQSDERARKVRRCHRVRGGPRCVLARLLRRRGSGRRRLHGAGSLRDLPGHQAPPQAAQGAGARGAWYHAPPLLQSGRGSLTQGVRRAAESWVSDHHDRATQLFALLLFNYFFVVGFYRRSINNFLCRILRYLCVTGCVPLRNTTMVRTGSFSRGTGW